MLIFKLSILFTLGVILSTIMQKLRLPDVLAYIITGLILGPHFLNVFTYEDIESLNIINQFAVCGVGVLIGKSLNIHKLKKYNFKVLYLAFIESIITFVFVFVSCYIASGYNFEFSILLAAIASVTAPMIPFIILKQFKSEGDLSKTIVPVIAIDSFIGIVLFYISLSVSKALIYETSLLNLVLECFAYIITTIVVGIILGFIFSFLFNKVLKNKDEFLIFAVGICFACVGVAQVFNLQSMILSMTIGIVVVNFTNEYEKIFDNLYRFAPPMFLAFFAATSALINIEYVLNIGLVGVIYIFSRTFGKLFGCYIGVNIFNSSTSVKKYLGLSILAQAGIILTMSEIVRDEIPIIGEQVYVIVQGGCFVFFIFGTLMTKFSINKAKEIND